MPVMTLDGVFYIKSPDCHKQKEDSKLRTHVVKSTVHFKIKSLTSSFYFDLEEKPAFLDKPCFEKASESRLSKREMHYKDSSRYKRTASSLNVMEYSVQCETIKNIRQKKIAQADAFIPHLSFQRYCLFQGKPLSMFPVKLSFSAILLSTIFPVMLSFSRDTVIELFFKRHCFSSFQ